MLLTCLIFDRIQAYVSQVPSSNCRTLLQGTYAPSASTTQSYDGTFFGPAKLAYDISPTKARSCSNPTATGPNYWLCTIYAAPAVPLLKRLPPTNLGPYYTGPWYKVQPPFHLVLTLATTYDLPSTPHQIVSSNPESAPHTIWQAIPTKSYPTFGLSLSSPILWV